MASDPGSIFPRSFRVKGSLQNAIIGSAPPGIDAGFADRSRPEIRKRGRAANMRVASWMG
jgi:hypothetical protein